MSVVIGAIAEAGAGSYIRSELNSVAVACTHSCYSIKRSTYSVLNIQAWPSPQVPS